jgi:hypothetical protein
VKNNTYINEKYRSKIKNGKTIFGIVWPDSVFIRSKQILAE